MPLSCPSGLIPKIMKFKGWERHPGHLSQCDAKAEKQGNQVAFEELSSSKQIRRENKLRLNLLPAPSFIQPANSLIVEK